MGTSMSISMPELYSDWIQLQVLSGRTKTELEAGVASGWSVVGRTYVLVDL